jgi:hypothetical protein
MGAHSGLPLPLLPIQRLPRRTFGATKEASRWRLRSAVLASRTAALADSARSRFCASDMNCAGGTGRGHR